MIPEKLRPGTFVVDKVGGRMGFLQLGPQEVPPGTTYIVRGFEENETGASCIRLFCPVVGDDLLWELEDEARDQFAWETTVAEERAKNPHVRDLFINDVSVVKEPDDDS